MNSSDVRESLHCLNTSCLLAFLLAILTCSFLDATSSNLFSQQQHIHQEVTYHCGKKNYLIIYIWKLSITTSTVILKRSISNYKFNPSFIDIVCSVRNCIFLNIIIHWPFSTFGVLVTHHLWACMVTYYPITVMEWRACYSAIYIFHEVLYVPGRPCYAAYQGHRRTYLNI